MAPEDVDKLITFGQMALEQGWYDKARELFEQALALDADNREAMKGLARVNEILSRREAMAVEPMEAETPTGPPLAKRLLIRVNSVFKALEEYSQRRARAWEERAQKRAREADEGGSTMSYAPQDQRPIYVVSQVSPETEGAAATALWLEIIFGLFSLLGVGHVYAGRIALGIIIMIGWWLYIILAGFVSSITFGVAACLFGPLYFAVPIISGIQARTYIRKTGGTGNWSSVAIVAGGGCLLVIVAIVLVVVFVIGLGAILGSQ
jgi:hypothetical protein